MIRLTLEDIQNIIAFVDLSGDVKARLSPASAGGLYLEDEFADILRDLCNDALVLKGFDQKYELNDVGAILQSLSDKLYIS